MWNFSKKSNQLSTFSFISPIEVLLFNMWVEYYFVSVILNGKVHMELLDAHKFLFRVKVLKWPPVYINDVVFDLCENIIIFFIMACQFIVSYYIHDDVIKHQTPLHNTYRIINTYVLLFQWIHNRKSSQGNIFWWR